MALVYVKTHFESYHKCLIKNLCNINWNEYGHALMNQSQMFQSSQSFRKFNETISHHVINSYTHIDSFSKLKTTTPWNQVTTTTMLSSFAINKSFKCNIPISKVSSWSKHKIWPLTPIYVRTHLQLQKNLYSATKKTYNINLNE